MAAYITPTQINQDLPEVTITNPNPVSVDAHDRLMQLGYLQQVIALADQDFIIRDHLMMKIHEVLAFAHLRGFEIENWDEKRWGKIQDYEANK